MNKLYSIILITIIAAIAWGSVSCGNGHNGNASYDGIDVSWHQKSIDWEKVACDDNITFVYIKATEGSTIVDPKYHYNIEQARRNGIKVGSYHYFSTLTPVKTQFANFSKTIDAHKQDLIPVIDVEAKGNWSRAQLIDSVKHMARLLEKRYHCKPMIYSTMRFYNAFLAPQLNNYPLYIGRYADEKPLIKWEGKYTIWQYSEDGIVTGINHRVDLCTFHEDKSIDDISM